MIATQITASRDWIFFSVLIAAVIGQRFVELAIAKRNTRELLKKGAVEFGADHYWMVVAVHVFFFCSLAVEAIFRNLSTSTHWFSLLGIFIVAQVGRVWVIRSMNGRWTTRIIVLPGETLVKRGPFRFLRHPNYLIVAIELFTLPMIFDLYLTAILTSLLNTGILLAIRIPAENRALSHALNHATRTRA